jgi:hypothetical protein
MSLTLSKKESSGEPIIPGSKRKKELKKLFENEKMEPQSFRCYAEE